MTRQELEGAPAGVRAVIKGIPKAHFETLPASEAARKLADAYVESKAVGPTHYNDAMHIAIASIGGVDVLASWNFKHMVNWGRMQACNGINTELGYPEIDIRSPQDMYHEG